MDLLLPRRKDDGDESLGGFIRRRLGKEVLDNITEPLLAGIYAGDTQSLSLQATFPQFRQIEHEHRSLMIGMLAGKKNAPAAGADLPKIAGISLFLSFDRCLSTLVERLEQELPTVRKLTGAGIAAIEKEAAAYRLRLEGGKELQAEGLIMALPAMETASLLSDVPEADWLNRIAYLPWRTSHCPIARRTSPARSTAPASSFRGGKAGWDRLKELRARLAIEKPGVWLCGAGFEGVGIPDCIEQGRRAAEQAVS